MSPVMVKTSVRPTPTLTRIAGDGAGNTTAPAWSRPLSDSFKTTQNPFGTNET
jgi:hypothetical protein